MLQAWATGSGRQVYCYQAGIIQKQHKKLDASIKKIRSSADTSARAIYQPMPPLFSSLHMGGRCGASYTLDISEGQASKL